MHGAKKKKGKARTRKDVGEKISFGQGFIITNELSQRGGELRTSEKRGGKEMY
jgi:hypothetical protein